MNWDQHLSSVLSETDESLAKMRERLTPHVRSHRRAEGASLLRDITTHPRPSPSLSPTTQWSDLTAIQSQLQQQTQTIESLTQNLRLMEREHTAQQRQIGTLQEEQRRLQERLADRTRDSSPGMDGRIERWKKEMDRELSSLRGRISRATAQEQHEESFSSKLHREELEQLRREVDLLSGKLMRQEEDTFQLQSEARETRRQYDRSSKALEKLSDSFLSHSLDLSRTVSQYHHTQQEVQNLRIIVSELKNEVKGLVQKEVRPVSPNIPQNTAFVETAKATVRRRVPSGSEDDFSLTPTLGEISSDDLDALWLEEAGPQTRTRRRRRHHAQLKSELSGSDLTGSDDESTLGDHLNLVSEGMSRGSNSPPDLSLSDL